MSRYQVIKREVRATEGDKDLGFTVLRYYITWNGREPGTEGYFKDPFVEVWADGSITANYGDQRIFFYDDQWVGIVKAVEVAMRDKKEREREERERWILETMDNKEFYGISVDLSRREVIEALTTCQVEVVEDKFGYWPQISYDGQNWRLCRTDLKDDVATGLHANKSAEEWRDHYLRRAQTCYGGRLRRYDDGGSFCVIDSFSDG